MRPVLPMLGAGLVALSIVNAGTVAAAPNPYGRATSTMQISVDATGGYAVVHTMTQEPRLESGVRFAMVLPDAVRLPDDPARPMPGLLVAPVTEVSGEYEGEPVEVDNASIGHRLDYGQPYFGETEAKVYTGVLRYTRNAASVPDEAGVATYIGLPRASDVELTTPGELLEVRCGTRPGVFEACGTKASGAGRSRWQISISSTPRNSGNPK